MIEPFVSAEEEGEEEEEEDDDEARQFTSVVLQLFDNNLGPATQPAAANRASYNCVSVNEQ